MNIKHLLLASMAIMALPASAQVHGQDGYYNYTAQRIMGTGNMFTWFTDGTKDADFLRSDAILDGDYTKFILGVNGTSETNIKVGNYSSTTKAYEWRTSFNFMHDQDGATGYRLKLTKQYPVVAWKFALPVNSVDSAYTDVFAEHYWVNPETSKCEQITWKQGLEGLGSNARCTYASKYPGIKIKTDRQYETGRDSVCFFGTRNPLKENHYTENGITYSYSNSKDIVDDNGNKVKTMVVVRLPDNKDKAEFVVLINYGAVYFSQDNKNLVFDSHDVIEIPRWHMNFFAYAPKTDADGNNLPEAKRPTAYIKWMKTFKSIDDVFNSLTEDNCWGDIPATLLTAESGFCTYAASYPVDYSAAGIDAYRVKVSTDQQTVSYYKVKGVVPAGKAVLVKGDVSSLYDLPAATAASDEFDTDLIASDGNITTDENSSYYAFATKDNKSGFKKLATGLTIPSRKGYLKLSSGSNAKSFFEFNSEATGIDKPETVIAREDDSNCYNITGQRINESYKGLVIKNGKKFINK